MAICVVLNGTTLEVAGEFSEACAGFALMSAQEYQSVPTLATLFAIPEPASVQAAFMAGISLPLILWLTSWGFGVVVNWFNDRTDAAPSIDEDH